MLRVGHQYLEDITALLRKNEQFVMCHVESYNRQNSRLDLQELSIVQLRRLPMSYTIRLNDWWCDCWDFQALQLPCAHVIAVCSACHLQLKTFVDPIYSL